MTRNTSKRPLLAALLATMLVACVPIEVDDDGSSGRDADTTADAGFDVPFDFSGDLGPDGSAIPVESDSCLVTTAGGTCSLLDGEVRLEIPADGVTESTTIQVTRQAIRFGDQDWVGYVWGPHGMPIDPWGRLTITVPPALQPPNPESLHLAVKVDDTTLELLANPDATDTGDGFAYSGDLPSLRDVIITDMTP